MLGAQTKKSFSAVINNKVAETKRFLRKQRILVLGLGKSGFAAAKKLAELGVKVLVTDKDRSEELKEKASLLERIGVEVKLGSQSVKDLNQCDLLIVSPGIPINHPLIKEAKSRLLPIWSELELASRLTDKSIIAVTGTNGKTTTVTMIGEILNQAGVKGAVAGNIGNPLIEFIGDKEVEVLITEVSSFQLETCHTFKPYISVMLNITPDHFDWHPNFEEYWRAKQKIYTNQDQLDFAVINHDDSLVSKGAKVIRAQKVPFSKRELEYGICLSNNWVVARLPDEIKIFHQGRLRLLGEHNLENSMAAAAVAVILKIDPEQIAKTIYNFKGLPHRLEFVAEIEGVKYYNDSKATNPDATLRALLSFDQPVILLLGGRNKGNTFTELAQHMAGKVAAVVLFGEAALEIKGELLTSVTSYVVETVEEAVEKANQVAKRGEVVLFSPACASFDAFKSYAERGSVFKQAVEKLLA
jgi:UDP-N-acetylmuramoylalanine--D-glutamate ligase